MKKTVKICIYNKSSSKNDVLLGNGDAILDNICLECKVHENLDGTYEIDAEFIIDNEGLWQHLEEEAILKVRLDYGYEYFRITQPRKTSNRIIVYGRQVTIYETMHLWLTDVRPENQDGAGALHWILDHATGIKELEVASDIQTVSTAYYMDMNMYEALHDCDQSFFNRWGGEIQRRGYTLRINQRIGTDRGVEIRSRKNLTGFEAKTNIDNVVTRIKPKGFDGITIDGFVDSEYINKYPRIKTKEIKYEDVKVKGENSEEGFETLAEAQAELTRLAKLEYSENEIDVITAEYNISFVDLSKTEEYKEYIAAERVYLGDTVNVYEEKLDINVSVRAIDKVYDVLGERVEEIKLSNKDINKLHSLNDILTDILKGVQDNNNSLQEYIQKIINSGIQDSYVFYNKAELVICDSPEIENAINVWRFNRGGLAHSSNGYSGPYNVAITYDGKINADMILAGLIKGNYIDARNLSVTRTDGTKTLEVTAGGDVILNVESLKIQSEDVSNKLSEVKQTAESVTYRFENSSQANLLPHSGVSSKNTRGWYIEGNGGWYQGHDRYLGISNNGTSEMYAWSPTFSSGTSGWYSLHGWINAESNVQGADVFIIGSTDDNMNYDFTHHCSNVGTNSGWHHFYSTFEVPSNIRYLRIRVDNNGRVDGNSGNYVVAFFGEFMLVRGKDNYPLYTDSVEGLYAGVTSVDKKGVHVTHDDGSSTNLNAKALNFYNSSNTLYAQVANGVYKFWNGSNYIGYLGHAGWSTDTSKRNISFAGEYGNTLTFSAKKTSSDTNYQTWLVVSGHEQTISGIDYHQGVMLIKPRISSTMYFYGSGTMGDTYPGIIFANADSHLAIMGDSYVDIGIQSGSKLYNGIRIDEASGNPYTNINMFGNLNMNGWSITNANMASSVSATSAQTYALRTMALNDEETYSDPTAKAITDIFPSQTPTEGEIRWTDRETYFTSEVDTGVYECYIEIPWWIAQNLENNYHVSITPTNGFYQYYVSERDPYYFIVRSDKDSMGFTFEIVGKLLDNNTTANNASVAGDQYLASDLKEPEAANIITKQEDIIDDGEQS